MVNEKSPVDVNELFTSTKPVYEGFLTYPEGKGEMRFEIVDIQPGDVVPLIFNEIIFSSHIEDGKLTLIRTK